MSASVSVVADTTKLAVQGITMSDAIILKFSANFAFMEIRPHKILSDSIIVNSSGHGNFCLKEVHTSCYILTFTRAANQRIVQYIFMRMK